jgi:hypothetical protein
MMIPLSKFWLFGKEQRVPNQPKVREEVANGSHQEN